MDLCIAICKKDSLSAPDGLHVGQGEERGSYFNVATDILGSL